MLSKIKETQVIANIGDKQAITIVDLYKGFNIKSFDDEKYISLALQFKLDMEDMILHLIKLYVERKLLSLELEKQKYMENDKMKKMCEGVEKLYLRLEYFKRNVKTTKKDIRKEYDKNIKMIKPEYENEISVKLMFNKTKSEAEASVKEYKYKYNPNKFGTDFKARKESKDRVIDLQYLKRQEVHEPFWRCDKEMLSWDMCCTPNTNKGLILWI